MSPRSLFHIIENLENGDNTASTGELEDVRNGQKQIITSEKESDKKKISKFMERVRAEVRPRRWTGSDVNCHHAQIRDPERNHPRKKHIKTGTNWVSENSKPNDLRFAKKATIHPFNLPFHNRHTRT